MEKMKFEVPPVGVKILDSMEGFEGTPVYNGVSYCDAVRRATLVKRSYSFQGPSRSACGRRWCLA